ncbi:hypothetical protein KP509_01G010100 [Ceratopteris richardii]|uniref:BZIP domain-containing protein n=1 Tax=Ceratopteris richardii TaxID=49495 RepID=A0A8T2VI02_CERRI|nr:hypothetical protein KP509_01G010100 [Ceratopteris richardii]
MITVDLDSKLWSTCDLSLSSLQQESPQDRPTSPGFRDLPSSPGMMEEFRNFVLDFDAEILGLDLPPIDDCLLPFDVSDPSFIPDEDFGILESCDLSSDFQLKRSDADSDKQEAINRFPSDGSELSSPGTGDGMEANNELGSSAEAGYNQMFGKLNQGPTDAYSLHTKSQEPTVSSHESDAGSCVAVKESLFLLTEQVDKDVSCTSLKRQYEDIGNDLDAVNKEAGSGTGPLDKRQRRLLRNRELAFESRQRKKCYVSDLEKKCRILEQERNQLQQQLGFVSAENAVLKRELFDAKKRKGNNGAAEPAVLFWDSLQLEFLLLRICLLLMVQLSLYVTPCLTLNIRTNLFLGNPGKTGGLAEKQRINIRPSIRKVNCVKSFCNHSWQYVLPTNFDTWQEHHLDMKWGLVS